jgi:hypothetical protein
LFDSLHNPSTLDGIIKQKAMSHSDRTEFAKETAMTHKDTFLLGNRPVRRMGYGAMQLAGKGVFGPPKNRAAAVAVLKEAVASGVNHIDTSDFYGPHITNQIIREALRPCRLRSRGSSSARPISC